MARRDHPAIVNPKRWVALRRRVITLDGYRCRLCGRAGRLEVDHKTPVAHGGEWWAESNTQALCRNCHFRKTARENTRRPNPEGDKWREYLAGQLP